MSFKRHTFHFAIQEKNSWNSYFLNFSSIFLSSPWKESFAGNVSYLAVCIDNHIELYRFVSWISLCHAFSVYLTMPRTKKFASKLKFRRNKYVVVNKTTSMSERRQRQCDRGGRTNCEKHNFNTFNKKVCGTSVNIKINVGRNIFVMMKSVWRKLEYFSYFKRTLRIHEYHHHHKHQELNPLIRSVSRVTAARANASSVFEMFSFFVVCGGIISKGFGFVAFFPSVKVSSVCVHLSCLVCL